jgi:O-antigen/teichoic acid export membrane protein
MTPGGIKLRLRGRTLDERSSLLLLTAGASYLGRFGSGIVLLVTIPMTRSALPPELFGVWMMLSSLVGFFAFADLGVGNGVLNRVTAAIAIGDRAGLRRTIIAGYACTFAVGVLLLLGWAAWVGVSDHPARIAGVLSPAFEHDVVRAFTAFTVLLAINISASLVQKIQLGAQAGHWIGIAQFVAAAGTLAGVTATVHLGGGLTALVFASLGVQVAVNLASTLLWIASRRMLARSVENDGFDIPAVRALLRTGSLFLALQLAVAFAFQSDVIVITQTLGASAYGDFAVVQKLFLFVTMILAAGLSGLWPAFGDAIARRDMAWARRTLARSLMITATFAVLSVLALILSMGWITRHWLHLNVPPPLALCLVLGAWTVLDALGSVCGAFLNGANVLRAQLIFAVCMASLAFAGKWWLTPVLGSPGAVLATLLSYLAITVPGTLFIFRRMFAPRPQG